MASPVANPPSLYTPLDRNTSQIRLIHLQPRLSPKSDEIICSLHLADLDDESCKYEALSYEWGDSNKAPLFIELDGRKRAIRENLWWALWNLRYENDRKESRVLWIDALCIDQDNEIEKSQQVRQMGRLYERASRVIAWVGREECIIPQEQGPPRTSLASDIETLFGFANLLHDESGHRRYFRMFNGWHSYSICAGGWWPDQDSKPIARNHPSWDLLSDMYRRSYWARLWIIQEYVLARDVMVQCGRFCFRWSALEHMAGNIVLYVDQSGLLTEQRLSTALDRSNLQGLRLSSQRSAHWDPQGHRRASLSELFDTHHGAKCLDVRDKIFGLLGMSSSCCQGALDADYGISTSDLCRRFLTHHLQCSARQSDRRHISYLIRLACPIFNIKHSDTITREHFPIMFLHGQLQGAIQNLGSNNDSKGSTRPFQNSEIPYGFNQVRGRACWPQGALLTNPWSDEPNTPSTYLTTTLNSFAKVIGDACVGDLVFQFDIRDSLILRKQAKGLLVVGRAVPIPPWTRFVDNQIERSQLQHSEALLRLDYWALCGVCLSFPAYEFPSGVFAYKENDDDDDDDDDRDIAQRE